MRIVSRLVRVLPTVHFDYEANVSAEEIDNEPAKRHLAAKLEATEPSIAQMKPEPGFGVGLRSS